MGRIKEKKDLQGRRGPGKKAKKQSDPSLPPSLSERSSEESNLKSVKQGRVGGRIKQRARRRARLIAAVKATREEASHRKREKQKTKKEISLPSLSDAPPVPAVSHGFSDENQKWLKPILKSPAATTGKSPKRVQISVDKRDLLSGGSDGNSSEEGRSTLPSHQLGLRRFTWILYKP